MHGMHCESVAYSVGELRQSNERDACVCVTKQLDFAAARMHKAFSSAS